MPQLTVDAARVNRDAEALCDSLGQLRTGDPRLGGSELCHKLHKLVRQLVPGPRTAFAWQQPSETSFLKGCLRLIERRTREAEPLCCLADRLLVDFHLPQHLVLHLQQIFRIEEVAAPKSLVPDVLGARIQCTRLAKKQSFGLWWIGHDLL